MNKHRSIMFVGTGSDVGKSIITTGICRILTQEGYSPAPFKAQNMSLNSYVTPAGLEIGRAQAVQAEACKIDCHTDMNPVLLKPTSNKSSQVVLNGKPVGDQSAREYFMSNGKAQLFQEVKEAYDRLASRYSPIVLEGAGSISELNLKHRDIVNMRMAAHAQADVFLVADIDRGGVFASVYGSIALLEEWEKKLIKGVIINKFRGDASLFEDGKKKLEELTGVPVVGVVPYLPDMYIEDEDSVALDKKQFQAKSGMINVVVVQLPHLSNYTDFDRLEHDRKVHLYYSQKSEEIRKADIVIIPGTKNTLGDLLFLKKLGIDEVIREMHANGKKVVGICGGYQMMGIEVSDPHRVESDFGKVEGLGLLPISTELTKEKTTLQRTFYLENDDRACQGYEIHMGITRFEEERPVLKYDGGMDGYVLNDQCWGTYMHGVFDNQPAIDYLLGEKSEGGMSHQEYKEYHYDLLADHLRKHLNLSYFLSKATV